MSSHCLYRFYDAAGELLYIGITMNPVARWKQHGHDKLWWVEVASIAIESHLDRDSALRAERQAIAAERPRWNVVHNKPVAEIDPGVSDQLARQHRKAIGSGFSRAPGAATLENLITEAMQRKPVIAEAMQRKPATVCRACGGEAVYSSIWDRFFHIDGTSNRECWAAVSSGRAGDEIWADVFDKQHLPAYRTRGGLVRAWCDYCVKWHTHGGCNGTCTEKRRKGLSGGACECPKGTGDGHRVAHCVDEDSPYRKGGYYLVEIGPAVEAVR